MIDVSIIIVNYNSSQYLKRCVKSIRDNCKAATYEIIVVDNGSRDDEIRELRQLKGLIDAIVETNANRGFGSGNNTGARGSKGKYLLFLNPDTVVLNDIVSAFVKAWNEIPGVGMLGAHQLNEDLTPNHSHGTFKGHAPTAFLSSEIYQNVTKQLKEIIFGKRKSQRKLVTENSRPVSIPIDPLPVDWINGACLFTSSEIYGYLGGFDERFFLFSEETDLQLRLKERKLGRYLVSGPRVVHLHEDRRKMTNGTRINYYRGYFTYCKIWNSLPVYLATKFCFILITIIGNALDVITRRYTVAENTAFLRSLCK